MTMLLKRHLGKLMLVILVAQGVLVSSLFQDMQKQTREATVATAVENAKATINQYKLLRAYYAKNVISKAKHDSELKISFEHKDQEGTIPLPATMIHDLSKQLKESGEGVELKLYSSDLTALAFYIFRLAMCPIRPPSSMMACIKAGMGLALKRWFVARFLISPF